MGEGEGQAHHTHRGYSRPNHTLIVPKLPSPNRLRIDLNFFTSRWLSLGPQECDP